MATIASSSDSIFVLSAPRSHGVGRRPIELPSRSPVLSAEQVAIDTRLAAVIDAPLPYGQTAMEGYRDKEIQLVGILCRLSIMESRALHARLSNPRPSDELATKFMRLTVERRGRLLNFLADARRRAAVGGK